MPAESVRRPVARLLGEERVEREPERAVDPGQRSGSDRARRRGSPRCRRSTVQPTTPQATSKVRCPRAPVGEEAVAAPHQGPQAEEAQEREGGKPRGRQHERERRETVEDRAPRRLAMTGREEKPGGPFDRQHHAGDERDERPRGRARSGRLGQRRRGERDHQRGDGRERRQRLHRAQRPRAPSHLSARGSAPRCSGRARRRRDPCRCGAAPRRPRQRPARRSSSPERRWAWPI